MITVVAHMDVKWGAPKLDRCQWAELVGSYGGTLRMVSGDAPCSLEGPVAVFDEHGDVPLDEFEHFETGTYVFGRSGTGMLHKTVPHTVSVRIVTPHPNRALFGVSAAAIVLHDRYMR